MTKYDPTFYIKNSITSASQITPSSGPSDVNTIKLIDRNQDITFSTASETTGTRTITITYTGSIDTIFIQNHNMEDFTIKYNTTLDFSTPIAMTGNTETNSYFEFNSQAVTSILISITKASSEPSEVRIGQIYIGQRLFRLPLDETATNSSRLLDVNSDRAGIIKLLSDATSYKISIRKVIQFNLSGLIVTEALKTNLDLLENRNRNSPIGFIPYPDTSPDSWDGIGGHFNIGLDYNSENFEHGIIGGKRLVNLKLFQAAGVS